MTSDYHTVGARRDRERAFGLLSRLVSSVERIADALEEREITLEDGDVSLTISQRQLREYAVANLDDLVEVFGEVER